MQKHDCQNMNFKRTQYNWYQVNLYPYKIDKNMSLFSLDFRERDCDWVVPVIGDKIWDHKNLDDAKNILFLLFNFETQLWFQAFAS